MKVNHAILTFFKNCFNTAETIAAETNLVLTHGTIDLPGLRDVQETVAHFPLLKTPENISDGKFTISFTTLSDFSPDLDGKYLNPSDGEFKTPWLRFSRFLNSQTELIPFRITIMENNFINSFKKNISFLTGIKSIKESNNKIYTAQFTADFEHLAKLKDFQNMLDEIEKLKNIRMLRVDSRNIIFDIECRDESEYTTDIIKNYIEVTEEISLKINKLCRDIINDMSPI